jgi:hypothetical protein
VSARAAKAAAGARPSPDQRAAVNLADDVVTALRKLAAGVWLLDGLHSGELLTRQDDAAVPWWYERPFPMAAGDLRGWLEDMALDYVARALDEGYRDAVALFERIQTEGRTA